MNNQDTRYKIQTNSKFQIQITKPLTKPRLVIGKLVIGYCLVIVSCILYLSSAYAGIGQYDFGDNRSETLAAKAWDALIERDYDAILAYAKRCISLYESRAIAQQNLLKELPTGDDAFQYWALNDVGTCYYLMGEAHFAKKKYKLARRAYKKAIRKFPFAQYYDPAGFHVKVADSCNKKLVAVEAILGKEEESSSEPGAKRIDIREKLKEFDKEKERMRQKEIVIDNDT